MGVKGLWSLLNPVARPVQIESMEGKRLAIDSSIWLYQFQATMRDKDGRVLVNAHVLGFLRRINKLLFHGIKPVFVFDGGAPNLKRSTIAERKRKKQGAAINHAKTAEKLFAAQMRREAVKAAQQLRDEQAARDATSAAAAAARYADDAGDQIAEDAVYLEDLEGRAGPSVPRPTPQKTPSNQSVASPAPVDPAEERRKKFRKHDPYRLPETEMPTVSTAEKPDARLATEEELKQFIDEVHPEDIDVDSPEFRALPTEVQYEIIGDLRVRSRQQSHRRLADMLRAAPTALDFSRAQIKHLSQRNALTQQLLTVTDMVGKAHLTIPVRIAAERNREYVLVKRGEDQGGGWALGIREGTKANPIKVEEDKEDESESETESESDSEEDFEIGPDMSDVKAISPPKAPIIDPDLREFRRKEILDAIVRRYAPKTPAKKSLDVIVKSFGKRRQPESAPLFDSVEPSEDVVPTENDEALALALQQEELGSDEEEADPDLAKALALSRKDAERKKPAALESDDFLDLNEPENEPNGSAPSDAASEVQEAVSDTDESMDELEEVSLVPSTRSTPVPNSHEPTPVADSDEDENDFELVEVAPTVVPARPSRPTAEGGALARLEAPSRPLQAEQSPMSDQGLAKSGSTGGARPVAHTSSSPSADSRPSASISSTRYDATVHPVPPSMSSSSMPPVSASSAASRDGETRSVPKTSLKSTPSAVELPRRQHSFPHAPIKPSPLARSPSIELIPPSSDPPMEEVPIPEPSAPPMTPPRPKQLDAHLPDFHPETPPSKRNAADSGEMLPSQLRSPHRFSAADLLIFMDADDVEDPLQDLQPRAVPSRSASAVTLNEAEDEEDEDDENEDNEDSRSIEWSKSPSPQRRKRPALTPAESGETIPLEVDEEDVDMNRDDMDAEEDDYARFMAQIKNRDLNEVRTEIDDEIRVLNNQNKVAMRDSDEITQSMISQIQTLLRHFGIPYITAPMEAEAQCAKLAELGLVDGIITDDSDVFLFGGLQCFKNIFNDAKYAECFLLADINRELSLSRERLISLAFLLGSDYTIGLPGVGPVVALELLANFPGDDGVARFKDWWMRVQRGQDSEAETNTRWKKSFKKRYASNIFLTADWPNPLVREAYKYPTTDESKEPFHWGFPKLSALRAFLHEELSWSISKVDDELTPIVQRIARRGKVGALNKQGTLDPFFDMSVAAGNYAPRRRTTANVSKRLMAVIKQFREAEASISGGGSVGWGEMMQDLDETDPKGRGTGQKPMRPKARGTKRSATAEGKEEEGTPDADEAEPKKKRKTRSRKGTVSSFAASEGSESQATEVTEGGDVGEDNEELGVDAPTRRGGKKPRGRGRGRGRGRLANVERWNVIQKPD